VLHASSRNPFFASGRGQFDNVTKTLHATPAPLDMANVRVVPHMSIVEIIAQCARSNRRGFVPDPKCYEPVYGVMKRRSAANDPSANP